MVALRRSNTEGAAAFVIVTEWEQFRALDLARLKTVVAQPVIIGSSRHHCEAERPASCVAVSFAWCDRSGTNPFAVENPVALVSLLSADRGWPGNLTLTF